MRIIERLFEKTYIRMIKEEMIKEDYIKYLSLNTLKSKAAADLMKGKISHDFYKNVFLGGDISHHYTEVNKDFIKNYK